MKLDRVPSIIIKVSLSLAAIAMAALFHNFWFARPSQNQQDETVQRDHLATPPAPSVA